MNFSTLYDKIGKQPIKNTRISEIEAVFSIEELKALIADNPHASTISIPLDLKFGTGEQKMWFIRKQEK